jgi:DinB family protein
VSLRAAEERFARLLETTPALLVCFSDDEAGCDAGFGRWSKKEILGHLIDSAGNNHQRFVRAQLGGPLEFPGYQQTEWVAAQSYRTESWADLVNLWLFFNRHLLHVWRRVPEAALATPCIIGTNAPLTLEQVMTGYVDHLEHHLKQICS